jgi:hypothetical protein
MNHTRDKKKKKCCKRWKHSKPCKKCPVFN